MPIRPIKEIADLLGIPEQACINYGPNKAKIDLGWLEVQPAKPASKLVLVTAINPTAAGEGKTTTTIGLGDALRRIGKKACIALREPSLGPCFGQKGGATGGGHAQVAPMDEINLHFTGDFHAITSAHNLLSALLDNHVYWGNALGIDTRKIVWRRAMDMNDRALRSTVVGLGNNGAVREDGFDITVASEVMAIFCLAKNRTDLEARLSRMVVAQKSGGGFALAAELQAVGAMSALLKDALSPNLVQTLEGTPAFVHGGPFANIAHGCNSVIATQSALKLADIVVTEAGFGADLGAEKFLDIKCPQAGLKPSAIVIVATVRALKLQGGMAKADLARVDVDALRRGLPNLQRHVENMKSYGVPVAVAINAFTGDGPAESEAILAAAKGWGVNAHLCRHWAEGGKGAEALAQDVAAMVETESRFAPLYPDAMPLAEKIKTIATRIYRAKDVAFSDTARKKLALYEAGGHGHARICMAKTQYSFSADPLLLGAPSDFVLPVRDVRLSAGAGFVVALTGDILTMPGLPKTPAANSIGVDEKGLIHGLF
jgi:formate--tetrahydrofolate ligase